VKLLRNNAVFVVLVLAAAPLYGQPSPTPDTPPDTTGDGTTGDGTTTPTDGTDPNAAITGSITVTLSIPEMTSRIGELDAQTEEDARHVLRLQIQARKEKDVIKLNCINDKLLQIKALRNIIEGAKTDFEIAVSGNSADEQQYQFTRITLSSENVRQLREEANACAGEIPDHIGETIVEWEGPDLPDEPDGVEGELEPPGYASPFN
jgi:hypothetical protein